MASINWTAEAQRWLKDIHDYIAADSAEAAMRTIAGIHARVEVLLTFPETGYRYRYDRDIRILLYGHYRVAYLISRTGTSTFSVSFMGRSTSSVTSTRGHDSRI